MGFKAFVTFKTSGVLESGNFQVVLFGDITSSAMDAIIASASNGNATTIAQFNLLSNELKARYMSGYFASATYVRSLTLNGTLSIKTNGSSIGSDSATITEVTGSDGSQQTVAFLNTNELSYGYVMFRVKVGASNYLPARYQYSDIFLHDAGYGLDAIKALSGCVALFSGSNEANLSTSAQADTTNFSKITPNNKVVFDGWEKIGNAINAGGLRVINSSNNTYSASHTVIKSFNYFACVWSNLVNTVGINFFTSSSDQNQHGISITKVSGQNYMRLSSPTLGWIDTVDFDGNSGRPLVNWSQTMSIEFIITDTYVKVRWNGDTSKEYNLTKSSVALTRFSLDTQIGTTSRYVFYGNQASAINNVGGFLTFFTYHPGTTSNTTPDTAVMEKVTRFLQRIALKNE